MESRLIIDLKNRMSTSVCQEQPPGLRTREKEKGTARVPNSRKAINPRVGGYFHIGRLGSLAPTFASEIHGGAPNFASKNKGDKYPKFCPLNFRYDPRIGIPSQL